MTAPTPRDPSAGHRSGATRTAARLLTRPLAAALAPRAALLARALRDPQRAQERALHRMRAHVPALGRVRRLEDLRALPIRSYDDVQHLVARAADRDASLLSASPLVRFERSGGSSGAHKLVPMTRASLEEMNRAFQPWLHGLYTRWPGVASGCAYWSLSPMGQRAQRTTGGTPIGSEDDAEYFPAPLRAVLARVLAVPSVLGRFTDVERCRYATLRLLLQRTDLTLISVWSPTFLTLLMDALDRHLERLLYDLERGTCSVDDDHDVVALLPLRAQPDRARALRALAARGPLRGTDVWPRLALLSMWTHATASAHVEQARSRFPGVPVEGKGLLATEGVVSVPWTAPDPVLAVRSHVLEFLDGRGCAHAAHELEEGGVYEVLLTTGAGLVRYRLGDRVQVTGRIDATPCIRFLGRADATSDLVGEKLGASFVEAVLTSVRTPATRFVMLAPSPQATRYRLYIDDTRGDDAVRALGRKVEDQLCAAHPYRYARALGQLRAVEVVRMSEGIARYEAACVARGQRAGDIKPVALSPRADWDATFQGRPLLDEVP